MRLALALLAAGCSGGEPEEPPQSRPVEAPPGAAAGQDEPRAVVFGAAPPGPVSDPIAAYAIAAIYPEIAALDEAAQAAAVGSLNIVPAPCEPCWPSQSIASCAVAIKGTPPRGCDNLRALVARAAHLAKSGSSPDAIRDSIAYGDVWLPGAVDTPGLDVEVWLDPTSPGASAVPERLAGLSGAKPRLRPLGSGPASLALLAAERAGRGLPWLQAHLAGQDPQAALASAGLAAADLADPTLVSALAAEAEVSRTKDVRATPTWFVEGYRLRGLQSLEALQRLATLAQMDPPPGG